MVKRKELPVFRVPVTFGGDGNRLQTVAGEVFVRAADAVEARGKVVSHYSARAQVGQAEPNTKKIPKAGIWRD